MLPNGKSVGQTVHDEHVLTGLWERALYLGIPIVGEVAAGEVSAAEAVTEFGLAVGSRRAPIEVQGNISTTIGGRRYSGHSLDRMQGRGLVPSVIEDIIAHPTVRVSQEEGKMLLKNANGAVVINATGDVVTVWAH